jgi:D-alanyl-D-alanine carboxypeptidase
MADRRSRLLVKGQPHQVKAFEFYCSLGKHRNYEKVAEELAVVPYAPDSRRTAAKNHAATDFARGEFLSKRSTGTSKARPLDSEDTMYQNTRNIWQPILMMLVLISALAGCSDDDVPTVPLEGGTVVVDVFPDSIAAPWTLAGPSGYGMSGAQDHIEGNLVAGIYTIEWGAVTGWITPTSESRTLAAGATVTFSGIYDEVEPELPLADRLQAALDSSLAEAPYGRGASAAVLVAGEEVWAGSSGISHPSGAMEPDMLFGVGSIAESYTAALVFKLEEAGLLDLDDPLSTWLPNYQYVAEEITVRQLLHHSSGLFSWEGHPSNPYRNFYAMDHNRIWALGDILTSYLNPPVFPQGTGYSRSVTNYLLLQMIVSEVTGSTVAEQIRELLLSPLGLNSTFVDYFETIPGGTSIAHGWFWKSDGSDLQDIYALPRTARATLSAPYVLSSAADCVKWMQALLGGQVLGPASLAEMLDFHYSDPNVPTDAAIGCGVLRYYDGGIEYWSHGGWQFGYETKVAHAPRYDFTIVVFCNFHGTCISAIYPALLNVILAELQLQ